MLWVVHFCNYSDYELQFSLKQSFEDFMTENEVYLMYNIPERMG